MIIKQLLERKYFLLAVCWTAIITVLSLIKLNLTNETLVVFEGKDKLVHFIFYFFFVFFWQIVVKDSNQNLKILIIAIVYGMIIEVFQEVFTTTRSADILDLLANSLGAVTAYILMKKKYFKKISKHF
jgi:VanZ family protein